MNQSPLLVSPRYYVMKKHIMEELGESEEVFNKIVDACPHLLDPNYKGHSEDGKPCESLKIRLHE